MRPARILRIGAACYPEGHVESVNKTVDIGHLKEKVEAGCDFVTTQMFFDNNILYNYLYRIREKRNHGSGCRRHHAGDKHKSDQAHLQHVRYLPSGTLQGDRRSFW
ncbi:MAG: methylenetetrahydrofolate reductase [Clostridium fessum]